jgi:hypothetical protein
MLRTPKARPPALSMKRVLDGLLEIVLPDEAPEAGRRDDESLWDRDTGELRDGGEVDRLPAGDPGSVWNP